MSNGQHINQFYPAAEELRAEQGDWWGGFTRSWTWIRNQIARRDPRVGYPRWRAALSSLPPPVELHKRNVLRRRGNAYQIRLGGHESNLDCCCDSVMLMMMVMMMMMMMRREGKETWEEILQMQQQQRLRIASQIYSHWKDDKWRPFCCCCCCRNVRETTK